MILGGTLTPFYMSTAQERDPNYVVQYGDTLWDIAGNQLGNPYRWRDIHQRNPFINNPNLIYPGDILDIGEGAGTYGAVGPDGVGDGSGDRSRLSDKAIARPWYGVPAPEPEQPELPEIPSPVVPSPDFVEACGYIVPYSLEQLTVNNYAQVTGFTTMEGAEAGTSEIIHAEFNHPGLVLGDSVYINRGFSHEVYEGDVFVAFRPVREVFHPITEELVGTQIAVLGRIRVKAVEPGISAAEIVRSYDYIEVGNPIMPASELSIPIAKPFKGNARSYGLKVGNQLIGHIVAERSRRAGISQGDIVFIDIGAAQGVQPADSLIIFHEIGRGYPKQAVGRVVVLNVQEQTTTALVVRTVKEIEVGEKVVLMR